VEPGENVPPPTRADAIVGFGEVSPGRNKEVAPTLTVRDRTLFVKAGYAWLW
jgi:hypothetical protein